jgi:hypothetical protein
MGWDSQGSASRWPFSDGNGILLYTGRSVFSVRPDFCDDILRDRGSPPGTIALSSNLWAWGLLMSALEESCQEVLLAWTPSVVFLFIVLLRDWLYRRRRGIGD